jgi:hypothetical protein
MDGRGRVTVAVALATAALAGLSAGAAPAAPPAAAERPNVASVDAAFIAAVRAYDLGTLLQGSDQALIESAKGFCANGASTAPLDSMTPDQVKDMFGLSKTGIRKVFRTMALYYCPQNLGN